MAEALTKPSTNSPDASGDRDKSRGRSSPAQENLQGLEKVFIPYDGFLGTSATKEQLRRSIAQPVQTALDDLAAGASFLDALLGTSMLEPPIERHAEIMSDPRFSHPANAPTSSRIVNRLHQTYGNGHVQTVVDLAQAIQDEGLSGEEISTDIEQTIARKRGAGKPLERGTRAQMDRAFGRDFSDVSIHTDSAADSLAKALQAKAFTVGSDIFFREGTYQPGSESGKKLLGHELTHVVQQEQGCCGPAYHGEREGEAIGQYQSSVPIARATKPTIQRGAVQDARGNFVSFEFLIGTELRLPFAKLAKRLAADGIIDDDDLRSLRRHALRLRDTLDDHERMFMAGLLDRANVATLLATSLGPGASLVFPLASISPARVRHVIDLDRQPVPQGISATQARREIVKHAAPFKRQSAKLLAFAQSNNVALTNVLRAMLAAASDNTAGDKVMAGTAYAIAAAANHPMASDLLRGSIKVDALISRAFARLPGLRGALAIYITVAQGVGLKGDTVYVPTKLDIAKLGDRSAIIHELQHAQDDKAASPTAPPRTVAARRLELAAFRTQARYILDEMVPQTAAQRRRSVTTLGGYLTGILIGALVLEGQRNPARYLPVLVPIIAVAKPPYRRNAAGVARMLTVPPATLETAVLRDIDTTYRLAPGAPKYIDGLAGESRIHWINRI